MSTCSVCGGPAAEDPAFAHTPDCRIGQQVAQLRKMREFMELLERSSLGTPGAKALRKIGQLTLQNKTWAQIQAVLTPEEHAAAEAEIALLERELGNLNAH